MNSNQSTINNLVQLHILRGLAALYVAIGHAKVVLWAGGKEYTSKFPVSDWKWNDYFSFAIDMSSSAAQEFVIVFFVLSGFFITYSFDKNKWNLKDFYINRIVRIYPPYIYSVIVSISAFLLINYYSPEFFVNQTERAINIRMINSFNELNLETFIKSIFFFPNKDYIAGNISYWSLLPEWLFYLSIPFLITRINLSFFVTAILFLVTLFGFNFNNPILLFIFEYAFYFYLGAIVYRQIIKNDLINQLPSRLLCFSICIVLTIVTIGTGLLELSPYSHIFACLLAVSSILTLLKYPLLPSFTKIGVFLGNISYSLYLLHLPIYYLAYTILNSLYNQEYFYSRIYWLIIPIAILFSWISYLMIEKKSLQYITRLKIKHNDSLNNDRRR